MSIQHSFVKTLIWQVLFLSIAGIAGAESVPLSTVLSSKAVKATVSIKGQEDAFIVEIIFVNNSQKQLDFYVESGRTFDVVESHMQDLVVVNTAPLKITPRSKRSLSLKAFCKNRSRSSPPVGTKVVLGAMADGDLLEVCQYLDGKPFKTNTVRGAIWATTDGGAISSAYTKGERVAEVRALQEFLCKTLDRKLPPYSLMVEYRQKGNQPWNVEPVYLLLDADYATISDGNVRIVFEDASGRIVRELMQPTFRPYDNYKLEVRMYLEGVVPGMYYIRVYCGKTMQKEWGIEI